MIPESKRAIRQFAFLCGVIFMALLIGIAMDHYAVQANYATRLFVMVGLFAVCAGVLLAVIALAITALRSRQANQQPAQKRHFLR